MNTPLRLKLKAQSIIKEHQYAKDVLILKFVYESLGFDFVTKNKEWIIDEIKSVKESIDPK